MVRTVKTSSILILSAIYLLLLRRSSGINKKDDIKQMEKAKKPWLPVYTQRVKQIFLKILSREELFQKRWC